MWLQDLISSLVFEVQQGPGVSTDVHLREQLAGDQHGDRLLLLKGAEEGKKP